MAYQRRFIYIDSGKDTSIIKGFYYRDIKSYNHMAKVII